MMAAGLRDSKDKKCKQHRRVQVTMAAEPGGAVARKGNVLCLIGAGLSALIVLRELTRAVADRAHTLNAPLTVLIVDEQDQDQFGRGLAYASPWQAQFAECRGSRAELLNSPAVRMSLAAVIGPDGDFVQWLQQHSSRWQQLLGLVAVVDSSALEAQGGADWPEWECQAIKRWLAFNQAKLSAGHYETVYFPRCVYGEYLSDIGRQALHDAAAAELDVRYIRARATGFSTLNPGDGPHAISVTYASGEVQTLACDQFVYAAGDLPPSPLGVDTTGSAVVDNPYTHAPHRHTRIDAIRETLGDTSATVFTLALAGCGASAMDQLWAIRNDPVIMHALRQGAMRVVVVAPGHFPHAGSILENPDSEQQADPLRFIQPPQLQVITGAVARHLDPASLATAGEYFAAVESVLAELNLDHNPHLFMTFLRQFGAVEQTIRDGLSDIENFACNYHARLEAQLLFTPPEYWQALADIRSLDGALQIIAGRAIRVTEEGAGLRLTTDTAGSLHCAMLVNCTGARNPFACSSAPGILADLIACQLGVHNFTGGFTTSLDGRLQRPDGDYSHSAFLCTQGSIGLSEPAAGGAATFIVSNRLTAVRVAERAQRVAEMLAEAVAQV
jgi:uncharacterized NAD(P)/FAD-binding protein YdhS